MSDDEPHVIFEGAIGLTMALRKYLIEQVPLCRDNNPVVGMHDGKTTISLPGWVKKHSATLEHIRHAKNDFVAGWNAAKGKN